MITPSQIIYTKLPSTPKIKPPRIGPTTSGGEFQDTLVHEIHHLAVAIARELGVDLEGETPAYLAGDTMRAFADVVCKLGCR